MRVSDLLGCRLVTEAGHQLGHVFDVRFDPRTGRAHFRDISLGLADQPITDVAYDDGTGDLYAATDYGVLRLPDRARHLPSLPWPQYTRE